MDGTILVADDDRAIRMVLSQALTRAGCKVHATGTIAQLMRWIEEGRGDALITDVMMPDGNGLDMIEAIRGHRPDLPIIVISAQNNIDTALRAEAEKVWDYLPKPFDLAQMLASLRAAQAARPRAAVPAPSAAPGEEMLIGRSAPMQQLYRAIARLAPADLPVLITGESGAGKSRVARVIHEAGRAGQPLRAIGPANLETLAQGQGSLLLDDVDRWPEEAQRQLLPRLDSLPEGGARLLATAGPDAATRLRPDLYFRLAALSLEVPPLRSCLEDIPLHLAAIWGDSHAANAEALAALARYGWPGNLRQLGNLGKALALGAAGSEITAADVEALLAQQPQPSAQVGASLAGDIAHHLQSYFAQHGGALPPPGLYGRLLPELEIPLIEICLDATGGNQGKAAELLGLNRNTLRKKITDHGIEVTRRRKLM